MSTYFYVFYNINSSSIRLEHVAYVAFLLQGGGLLHDEWNYSFTNNQTTSL